MGDGRWETDGAIRNSVPHLTVRLPSPLSLLPSPFSHTTIYPASSAPRHRRLLFIALGMRLTRRPRRAYTRRESAPSCNTPMTGEAAKNRTLVTGHGGEPNVPVTARLSKRFYEVLGEDVATELVNWFNDVDATYRADLREMNELNFARFDAKLGERLAQLDAKWETRWAGLDAKWEGRWGGLDAKLARLESRLTWRMFAFWAPTALAVLGTGVGVMSLLLRH